MKYFDVVPEVVQKHLQNRGVIWDDLLYCVKSDLDGEGKYVDVYIAFSKTHIYIIRGVEHISNPELKTAYDFESYDEISFDDIENLFIQRYQNTAELYIKMTDGVETPVSRFSIGFADKFEKFIQRANAIKTNEPIDDMPLDEMKITCPKCGAFFPDPNRPICKKCVDRKSIFKKLLLMFTDFKVEIVLIIITLFLGMAVTMITPIFSSKMLYDDVLAPGGKMYGQIAFIVIVMASIEFVSIVLRMFSGIVVGTVTPKVIHKLRCMIFSSIQKLSLDFFTGKQTASLMSRIERDTGHVYWFFLSAIPHGIQCITQVVGIVVILFVLNPTFAVAIISLVIVIHLIDSKFWRTQRKFFRKADIAYRDSYTVLSDALNGQRVVKAFAKESEENKRFLEKSNSIVSAEDVINKRFAKVLPLVWTLFRMLNIVLFCVGAWLVINGKMLFGTLTTTIAFLDMMHEPINFFAWIGDRYARCTDSASRMFEIMETTPSVKPAENPVSTPELRGDIELKNVSFEYEAGRPIIKNANLVIQEGHMFGLVGKTGAGKSTIINLMARLYDVSAGEITIGGIKLKDISSQDLRHNIGIVSQETYLFMGTIADNIRYARPDASLEEVIIAAKSANSHEFITRLPLGYDTVVGDGGVSLSGGERQRISIARAIIQKPNILILDEATAAMDTKTERKIQVAIDNLKQGRTIISIAHRLSTLRDADMLCVLENGEIKEQGTHDELISKKGKYYDLYILQYDALKSVSLDS